ncbi:ABC transporter ATP-binding protein [Clostridium estertheticum]|uniref:ABC transporter ATP-binding protein n=1 Tax=Clostridium estertheticum TaxID=238834 RepID=UPI0013E9775F|nr:ABC transporter ATP-binding protein [Clostridium estertheticum]MBZ9685602.1 ABC transporter ATP-binding protein [Clostridium estertheticum]
MKNMIIKTVDLCKTYISDSESYHAIKNINLEIYEGDFTVIMGSSGSGKSTLLYLLSGLDAITSGEVCFQDLIINKLKEKSMANFRRKSIGFVFQGINLVPSLSIFENIAISGYLVNKDRKKVDERVVELLDLVGLSEELNRVPSKISGGQQQKVAIARALINQPKVIFADEPTGALNSSQGENILNILTELNTKGQSIVMVTHDIKAASRADRVLFIKDGRISGDLKFGKFDAKSREQREKALFDFLTEKGW